MANRIGYLYVSDVIMKLLSCYDTYIRIAICSYTIVRDHGDIFIYYRIEGNISGGKHWRMTINLPKFLQPKFMLA